MPLTIFVEQLRRHSRIGESDAAAINSLAFDLRSLAPSDVLIRQGERHPCCSILLSGFATSFKLVGSGARQVTDLHFPGQLVDLDLLLLPTLDYSVKAISRSEFALVDREGLLALALARPALAEALWRASMLRAAVAREWIANVSRRDARSAIAHVLCEIVTRRSLDEEQIRDGFDLPLNQDQLSEVVGLTPMHVSRVLGRLENEELIQRSRGTLRIIHWARLKTIGDFDPAYLHGMG